MGRNARKALRENTTPGERLEIGLELLDEEIERRIGEMDVPEELTDEERARWIARRLIEED